MKQTEIITLKQARKRMQFFEQVEAYKPITLIKKIVGYGFIGYGAITIWAPTGSVWAIMIGCLLLGIDYKRLLKTINFYGKESAYWFLRAWRLQ